MKFSADLVRDRKPSLARISGHLQTAVLHTEQAPVKEGSVNLRTSFSLADCLRWFSLLSVDLLRSSKPSHKAPVSQSAFSPRLTFNMEYDAMVLDEAVGYVICPL
jgi:hypothetical protein